MEKIKQFVMSEKGMNVSIVLILVLVSAGSFWLGRLSIKNSSKTEATSVADETIPATSPTNFIPIIDGQTDTPANALYVTDKTTPATNLANSKDSQNKAFFASSRGTKYYTITGCSGGKTISPENKIYFYTAEDAEKAGYTLSTSCKK